MSTTVTLAVNHLELQELQQQLGAENVKIEDRAVRPDKAYDVGLVYATLQITVPALTVLAGWLWSQRKAGRIVEETIKVKNADGSTFEHKVKYKATDPAKAVAELVQLLRSFFPELRP
jgi:hypothetical protein